MQRKIEEKSPQTQNNLSLLPPTIKALLIGLVLEDELYSLLQERQNHEEKSLSFARAVSVFLERPNLNLVNTADLEAFKKEHTKITKELEKICVPDISLINDKSNEPYRSEAKFKHRNALLIKLYLLVDPENEEKEVLLFNQSYYYFVALDELKKIVNPNLLDSQYLAEVEKQYAEAKQEFQASCEKIAPVGEVSSIAINLLIFKAELNSFFTERQNHEEYALLFAKRVGEFLEMLDTNHVSTVDLEALKKEHIKITKELEKLCAPDISPINDKSNEPYRSEAKFKHRNALLIKLYLLIDPENEEKKPLLFNQSYSCFVAINELKKIVNPNLQDSQYLAEVEKQHAEAKRELEAFCKKTIAEKEEHPNLIPKVSDSSYQSTCITKPQGSNTEKSQLSPKPDKGKEKAEEALEDLQFVNDAKTYSFVHNLQISDEEREISLALELNANVLKKEQEAKISQEKLEKENREKKNAAKKQQDEIKAYFKKKVKEKVEEQSKIPVFTATKKEPSVPVAKTQSKPENPYNNELFFTLRKSRTKTNPEQQANSHEGPST